MNTTLRGILAASAATFLTTLNLFAGTLPSGYTELEYVQATGAQYVDTGLRSFGNVHIETEFQLTDISKIKKSGDNNTLLGSCKSMDGNDRQAVRPIRFNMN